jgi:hypothetical protein
MVPGELPSMPLRKQDDAQDDGDVKTVTELFPPEAYQYEAELTVEKVKLIQAKADKVLSKEEWVIIDGVDIKR